MQILCQEESRSTTIPVFCSIIEDYTVYRYRLVPTFDFKQELLSRGPAMEVIGPDDFREELKRDIAALARKYGL